MALQIVTANRLRDGRVVYLAEGETWTEQVTAAVVAEDQAAADTLLGIAARAVAHQEVVEPYLIAVDERGGQVAPIRYREAIRATGPSVDAGPVPAAH